MSAVANLLIPGNGDLSQKFFEMQKEIMPDYSIEIGAHAAEFSLAMSSEFGVPALAFEASPDIHKKYSSEIDFGSVEYLNYAISDIDGEKLFVVYQDEHAGNNSILQRNGEYGIKKAYKVKSYRIDTYLKDQDFSNACLWIDVEGANKEVLMGAKETLKRVSSVFIETEDVEYWKDQWLTSDVIGFLESHGFAKVASEKVYGAQQNIIFIKIGEANDNTSN